MEKKTYTLDTAVGSVAPISAAVQYGDMLFLSGATALDPETGKLIDGGIAEQTEFVLSNLEATLKRAGMDISNVIKVNIFLADANDFAAMNEVYARHFEKPYPARICVQAGRIPLDAAVEIEFIAGK